MIKANFWRSIRFKIAVVFFAVFVLIVSVFNLYLFQTVRAGIIQSHEAAVSAEAESIVNLLSEDLSSIPVTKPDQPIQIWYSDILQSRKIFERSDFPEDYRELFQTLQAPDENSLVTPFIIVLDNYTFCMLEKVLEGSSGEIVSLILAKDNQAVYAQVQKIRNQMMLANFGAAILAFVAALLASRFTLKPIQRIIDKARKIKASEKMSRIPVSMANDELTDLAETINDMIERIEGAIQNQNQFFASAAHELRTPLANMLSELELRLSKALSHEERSLFQSQREEVIRLKYVVQDFLLMSQLKADTLTLNIEVFRLDDIVYDILEKMRHSINRAQFKVHFSMEESTGDLFIRGDLVKMESIIVNLIQNALKFGDKSEKLSIDLSRVSHSLLLRISNKIDHSKDDMTGNGLGLWICAQLAQKQGFEFQSIRKGDTFSGILKINRV